MVQPSFVSNVCWAFWSEHSEKLKTTNVQNSSTKIIVKAYVGQLAVNTAKV